MNTKLPKTMLAAAALCLAVPAFADHGERPGAQHGHPAHGAAIEIAPGPEVPGVEIAVMRDPVSGWNLHVRTTNFRFAPEHAGLPHIGGEGHAHLYVNGRKAARIYGAWHHIESLPPGEVELSVTLTANDHRPLSVGGRTVRATTVVRNTPHAH